jgi:mono/diheme cytochrome c family protein
MDKYTLIGLIALLILVAALPVYALLEPVRLDRAQVDLRQQFMVDVADIYVENCAGCHGAAGEGVGVTPPLNNPGLAKADHNLLYKTIAHSPHGTAMAAWHVDEGGVLNEYQVEGLVTLIRYAEWSRVGELAAAKGMVLPTPAVPEVKIEALEGGDGLDPHECVACHEEPAVHAGQFGLNCARCHTLQAWKPALLTRHTFRVDHGGEGQVSCQTCHTYTYSEHNCYDCHDHDPEQMEEVHVQEDIFEFANCVACHPTGQAGEGERFRDSYVGQASKERQISADDTGQKGLDEHFGDGNRAGLHKR